MSTSLTKKGLVAASDKVIVAARPALEIISQFTTDFSDEAVKPGTGIAVDVLAATAETFEKGTANYTHATNTIKNFLVATDFRKKSTFSLDDLDCIEDETAHCWDKFGPASGRAVSTDLIKSVTGKDYIQAARDVWAGKYGTNDERTQKLNAEGFDPRIVQHFVNRLAR
jgi:hypothetical protein